MNHSTEARSVLRSLLLVATIANLAGCERNESTGSTTQPSQQNVVIFTAHDRVFSEPILKAFQEQTGIVVKPVYDAEAAKTTGLINRLLARRDAPECDVLWNNEIVQTEALAQEGLLEAYDSPSASRIPAEYRDSKHCWTGFAGRLRVLIYNTEKFPAGPPPATLSIFSDPQFRGQGVVALPYYGTTFTHMSILRQQRGDAKLRDFLNMVRANGTAIAPGNGAACDLVASGECSFGLTDTDDANGAMLDGKPVRVLIPDPGDGAILIPNTVALIKGAPHADAARMLIDYLLSPAVEEALAKSVSAQIPLGTDLRDAEHPWRDLLKRSPPRKLPIKEIAADRRATIEMLRDAELDK